MGQNNFIIDLIAGLKKTASKQQIKSDVRALGDIPIKLVGNLNITKTRQNIKNQLKGFDLEFSGSGNKISYQSPQAGTRVLEGSSIRLMLTE